MVLREPLFGLDDFHTPRTLNNMDVLVNAILMMLFGKPGFYPSIPTLGIYIQQYFHYRQEELDIDAIKTALSLQCSILSDYISEGSIDVQKTLTDSGKLALLVLVPTSEQVSNNMLVVGISTDESGTIVYNYELMDSLT